MSFSPGFVALTLLLSSPVLPPQGKSPVQKPKPKTLTTATLGTVQMPGDNGKPNVTYQLGDKGSELHFRLESAALEAIHPAAEDMLVAGPKERLLALTFTVQNPLNREMRLGSSEFHFTAVSPDDENFEFRGYLLHPTKGTHISQDLKPAQKVRCTVVFPIYAEGPISKVIVQRGAGKVLRYDLTGKVQKLDSVFSADGVDLGDKGAYSSTPEGSVIGPLRVAFEAMSFTNDPIQGVRPPAGERYLTIDVKFTNPMLMPVWIGFQYYKVELIDVNGEKIPWNSSLLSRAMDATVYQSIEPGGSASARYYFNVPSTKTPKTIRFTHNDSKRWIEVPVTATP